MKYNPEIHHRRSIRLKGYDYTQAGAYFITICSHQREHLFGEVVDGEMKLSKFGLVAKQQWEKLPKRFPNIELGAFVLMPNHEHGIIQIIESDRRGIAEDLQNLDEESSRYAPTKNQQKFGKMIPNSTPTIIRSYKSAVAYRINLMRGTNGFPVWQRNYYEHIIRNEKEWELITKYIDYNPVNWQLDRDNFNNIRNLSTPNSMEDYLKDAEEMIGLKNLMNPWLVVCAIYNLGFAFFHLLFWKIFHWKEDLASLTHVNSSVMQILNLRLTYVFLLMAVVLFVFQAELVVTSLGQTLLAAFSIFWFMRAIEQIVFFGLRNWVSNSLTVIFLIGGILHLLPIF